MEVTPELAELFGAYVGDGTMSANRGGKGTLLSIAASKDEKEWLDYLAHLFEQIFYYRPKVLWNSNVYKIQIGVGEICEFFKKAGFPVGKKALTVRAPEVVMDADTSIISKAFLRGYFDADGCLCFKKGWSGKRYIEFKKTHHYYPQISICSISKDLIVVDVKHILDSVGLHYIIWEMMPNGKGECKKYFATINGVTQLELWMSKIGTSNPVHSSKYEVWKKFGFCPPKTTLEQRMALLSGELDPESLY